MFSNIGQMKVVICHTSLTFQVELDKIGGKVSVIFHGNVSWYIGCVTSRILAWYGVGIFETDPFYKGCIVVWCGFCYCLLVSVVFCSFQFTSKIYPSLQAYLSICMKLLNSPLLLYLSYRKLLDWKKRAFKKQTSFTPILRIVKALYFKP